MQIGERLRYVRQSKKMSIYKLAQSTGISQSHISDLELGRRKPSVETLSRLVAPLGITLSELFNENDDISILTPKERELIEYYRTLPENKADLLLQIGRTLNE